LVARFKSNLGKSSHGGESLYDHTMDCMKVAHKVLTDKRFAPVDYPKQKRDQLLFAMFIHDVGKLDADFQAMLRAARDDEPLPPKRVKHEASTLDFEQLILETQDEVREHLRDMLSYTFTEKINLDDALAAREELGVGFSEAALAERAGALVGRVSIQLPFLGRVRGGLSIENVVDMLENARRRIRDQRRYDDGVARLYRTLEMWHQWRLQERHSISTGNPDWSRMDGEAQKRFLEAAGLEELPGILGLRHARILDRVLGGEIREDDEVLRNLLQQRNRSILAHGLEPIDAKSAGRFLEYVDGLVEAPEARAGAEHATLRRL